MRIIRTVGLIKENLQGDPSDKATVPAHVPEIFEALLKASNEAGKRDTIQPPIQDTATETINLPSHQMAQQKQVSAKSKKSHNSNALITHPTSDQPCKNAVLSPRKGSPTLLNLDVPTTLTLAQVTVTRSLGHD
eukprot:1160629-Pelagomonas_calceolata.AAC.3